MANRTESLLFKTAKLVVAAAWADGEVANTELNALKQLLFALPGLTEAEWAELRIYLDSPVQPEEAQLLLEDVLHCIETKEDKRLVLSTLKKMMIADGEVASEEEDLLRTIQAAVEGKHTGFLGSLAGLGKLFIGRKKKALDMTNQREKEVDLFIRDRVQYDAKKNAEIASWSEPKRAKICAVATLLGQVAIVDGTVSAEETEKMAQVLQEHCGIGETEAEVLAEIVGKRMTDQINFHYAGCVFYEASTREERVDFLKALFQIANAQGRTSLEEIDEIKAISMQLKLTHKDYIEAKLTISRADRNGL